LQFVILFLHMHSTLVLTKELIFRYNYTSLRQYSLEISPKQKTSKLVV